MSTTLSVVTTCWGLLMALAPLLQIRIVVRDRDASGISRGWLVILVIGFVLWLVYGVVNVVVPIIVTNIVAVTVTAALLAVVWRFGRPLPEASAEV